MWATDKKFCFMNRITDMFIYHMAEKEKKQTSMALDGWSISPIQSNKKNRKWLNCYEKYFSPSILLQLANKWNVHTPCRLATDKSEIATLTTHSNDYAERSPWQKRMTGTCWTVYNLLLSHRRQWWICSVPHSTNRNVCFDYNKWPANWKAKKYSEKREKKVATPGCFWHQKGFRKPSKQLTLRRVLLW